MCKIIEDVRNDAVREEIREVVLRMLDAKKYELDEIATISGVSLDKVKKLQQEQL